MCRTTGVPPKMIRLKPNSRRLSSLASDGDDKLLLLLQTTTAVGEFLRWSTSNYLERREQAMGLTERETANTERIQNTGRLGDMKNRCSDKANDLVKNDSKVVYRPV